MHTAIVAFGDSVEPLKSAELMSSALSSWLLPKDATCFIRKLKLATLIEKLHLS